MLRTKAVERETLDEGDILEITGPRPPRWRTGRSLASGTFGLVRKGVKISRREHR